MAQPSKILTATRSQAAEGLQRIPCASHREEAAASRWEVQDSSGRRTWRRRRPTTARFGGGWRRHRARPLSTASGRGRRLIGEVSRGGATSPAAARPVGLAGG
uniref:Uncharacterized protein n=1 Tax=Arundo donax TaxID=35708 RepID=A0A0A9FC12_ARUDO